jgi:hypothetical protein
MTMTNDGMNGKGPLRETLEQACAEHGLNLKDLTVLDDKNDPFRFDTPAGHRDAAWFAELLGDRTLHNRGGHYIALGTTKPASTKYQNTDKDWGWIQKASKAARWLGYVAPEQVTDERNAEPVLRIRRAEEPAGVITLGGIRLEVPDEIAPSVRLHGWQATQPHRVALFGEKTSLEPILRPLSTQYGTDLLLPTGEASIVMVHRLAKAAAEDGRPLVILYVSDCDPAGRQMAVSVAWKLRAYQALHFPDLEYEMYPVALTPDQVIDSEREWGVVLPSSPLKDTEKRADRWRAEFGIDQTEIDALATLHPELLTRIVGNAIKPFYDSSLARRMVEVRREWEQHALERMADQLGAEQIEELRRRGKERIGELHELVEQVEEEMYIDELDGVELPPPPDPPEPQVEGVASNPPLFSSAWPLDRQARALQAHKSYGGQS